MKPQNSSLRKAAILLASLESAEIEALLTQMTLAQANALRSEIESLGELDELEQDAVIEEFFRIRPLVPNAEPAGIDLCGNSARQLGNRAADRAENRRPFQQLLETSVSLLAKRLRQERPQTIAVVVSHLPADRAAELLASLPESLQTETACRLVDVDQADDEVVAEIERDLSEWLTTHEQVTQRRTTGLRTLENILSAAGPELQDQMLSNLARRDHQLARQLAPASFSQVAFEELTNYDDTALAKILRQAEPAALATALVSAERSLVARAHRLLPVAQAARLRRDLTRIEPPSFQAMAAARRQITDLASDLERRGQLSIPTGRKLSVAI